MTITAHYKGQNGITTENNFLSLVEFNYQLYEVDCDKIHIIIPVSIIKKITNKFNKPIKELKW